MGETLNITGLKEMYEVIENLIRIEKEFWNEYVLKQVIPDPDGSKTADAAIAERFKESKSITIPLTGFDERLERRQELLSLWIR